jgi:hypothetical protein
MSRSSHFRPFLTIATVRTELYVGLHRLCEVLADPTAECLEKQSGAFTFMAAVQQLYGVRGLDHEPGKEDRYSNPGFVLLGRGRAALSVCVRRVWRVGIEPRPAD